LAFRAEAASIGPTANGELNFSGTVLVTEISGSESFIHVDTGFGTFVCVERGVSARQIDQSVTLHVDAMRAFVFDSDGRPATGAAADTRN
jgi:glycerol transport system ATP-binding protein